MDLQVKEVGKVRPTVGGDWDINNSYDTLTIVYDIIAEKSYISKKAVPKGTLLTNKTYWSLIGNTRIDSDSIVLLSNYADPTTIPTYSLTEAINSIDSASRRLGMFISFYEKPTSNLSGYRWNLYQFNSNNLDDFTDESAWKSIYYNDTKFYGWYQDETALYVRRKNPQVGEYAYVGSTLSEAVVYKCAVTGTWTKTDETVTREFIININGNITIGSNGNWYINGIDSGIEAKGPAGKDAVLENELSTTSTNGVQNKVIAEVVNELQTDIDSEVARAKLAETNLSSDISTETTRATAAEATITTKINTDVATEKTRATIAETTLQSNIDAEETRATAAETSIKALINAITVTGEASAASNVSLTTVGEMTSANVQNAIEELNINKDERSSYLKRFSNFYFRDLIGDEFLYEILDSDWINGVKVTSTGSFTSGSNAKSLEFVISKCLLRVLKDSSYSKENNNFYGQYATDIYYAILTMDDVLISYQKSVIFSRFLDYDYYKIRMTVYSDNTAIPKYIYIQNYTNKLNISSRINKLSNIFCEDYTSKLTKYINYNVESAVVGSIYEYNQVESFYFHSGIFDVSPNDVFLYQNYMENTISSYIIMDSNNIVLEKASGNGNTYISTPLKLIMPNNAAKLLINFDIRHYEDADYNNKFLIKLKDLNKIYENEDAVDELNNLAINEYDLIKNNILSYGNITPLGNITITANTVYCICTIGKNDVYLIVNQPELNIDSIYIRYYSDNVFYNTDDYKQEIYTDLNLNNKFKLDTTNDYKMISIVIINNTSTFDMLEYINTCEIYFKGDYGFLIENYFSVKVDINDFRTKEIIIEDNIETIENLYEDYCLFMSPAGHTIQSNPIKVAVVCHGSGEPIYESSTSLINKSIVQILLKSGYGILAVNGLPKQISDDNSLSYGSTVGNWTAIESITKAISYIKDKFNVSDDFYLFGISQGGMVALNVYYNTNINFKAICLDSPVISMKYTQLNLSTALPNLQYFYGFNSLSTFDENKCLGLDPFVKYIDTDIDNDLASNQILSSEQISNITSKRYFDKPIYIMCGENDTLCYPSIAQIFIKQILNNNGIAKFKILSSTGHVIYDLSTVLGTLKYKNTTYDITEGAVSSAQWFNKFGGYDVISLS